MRDDFAMYRRFSLAMRMHKMIYVLVVCYWHFLLVFDENIADVKVISYRARLLKISESIIISVIISNFIPRI